MAELEHILDHEEHAQGLLIDQYQEKQRIAALLASYTVEIQAAEDMLWDVRVKRFLDNAEGHQLDVNGAIVGEARRDREDDIYRPLIQVRIAINNSDGHADDVINCLKLLSETPFASGLPFTFSFRDSYPASFEIEVTSLTSPLAFSDVGSILAQTVRGAKAAGVGSSVLYSSFDEESALLFADIGIEESSSTTNGFCETGENEDTATTGGYMAGVFE